MPSLGARNVAKLVEPVVLPIKQEDVMVPAGAAIKVQHRIVDATTPSYKSRQISPVKRNSHIEHAPHQTAKHGSAQYC